MQSIDLGIVGPAFIAGLLVLVTHVPLGMQVLARGIVFIDLAVAQVAGLGVIAADLMGLEPQGAGVQIAAVSAALLASLFLTYTEKRWPQIQEAIIGTLFVLAASAGILLLANNPHGGEHLRELLVGQILWVNSQQLIPVAMISAALLAAWYLFGEKMGRAGFYVIFALAVTMSVQLVGVYLVFATLIVPALAVHAHARGRQLTIAYAMGAAGYVLGLVLSAVFDLPSGAVIVLVLALIGVLVHAAGVTRALRR